MGTEFVEATWGTRTGKMLAKRAFHSIELVKRAAFPVQPVVKTEWTSPIYGVHPGRRGRTGQQESRAALEGTAGRRIQREGRATRESGCRVRREKRRISRRRVELARSFTCRGRKDRLPDMGSCLRYLPLRPTVYVSRDRHMRGRFPFVRNVNGRGYACECRSAYNHFVPPPAPPHGIGSMPTARTLPRRRPPRSHARCRARPSRRRSSSSTAIASSCSASSLVEHERYHGYLETRLLRRTRRPRRSRSANLGWSGDTVRGEARTSGYKRSRGDAAAPRGSP